MSRQSHQADAAFDQRNVSEDANVRPDEMDIDPGRLFEHAMEQTRMAICLVDPHRDDMPIVFVNQAFEQLTGYDRGEVVGINCRFLQGPDTSPVAVDRIRRTMARQEVAVIDILNYRKDGSSFWNALHVGPIFDRDGRLTHFYGSQWDITEIVEERARIATGDLVLQEMQHRLGNLFAVLGGLIRISARETDDVATFSRRIEGRIGALGQAHAASIGKSGPADLHTLVNAVLAPYRNDRADRIRIEGAAARLTPGLVTPMGLVLHELATNALKYGALSEADGKVAVDWVIGKGRLTMTWEETGGPSPKPGRAPGHDGGGGLGGPMIGTVLETVGARFLADWRETGLVGTLVLPL